MDISCLLPSGPDTPAWIELAEELGYRRAWCFDTPPVCSDVWMTLALAAQRTRRIGLGPGMMVPSLRHVATNAVAVSTLDGLAPGRVTVGVGAGTTSRRLMGQRGLRWSGITEYVGQLRSLLRDQVAEVDGKTVRLCHPGVQRPRFPVEVPVLAAVEGPVGAEAAVAMEADGVFSSQPIPPAFSWGIRPVSGTVLDPGETLTSDRVVASVGPGAAILYHLFYDMGRDVDGLPGGAAWRAALEALPEEERPLAQWKGHLVHLSDLDEAHIPRETYAAMTVTGTRDEVADRIEGFALEGTTEIAFQPAGDVPDELRRFAAALRLG